MRVRVNVSMLGSSVMLIDWMALSQRIGSSSLLFSMTITSLIVRFTLLGAAKSLAISSNKLITSIKGASMGHHYLAPFCAEPMISFCNS